ncbi:DNA binding domain protein [Mycobacterium phage Sham4]|uniref:sigma-K factor n=1 Tax=Mycobacterium phage Mulciber TaxID=1805459 RepID=UPI00078E8A66|nr:sigma-K factor [Mycobacterium phage Mulciber]ASR86690.1 hypothetical protein SEA_ET2BRUTUS_52 [Mycobacterium phage Et2Brutus]AXC33413.1 hypothetical protein SEA_EBONY_53 [Mycobacterium phage Ebony]AXC33513.1 hypothetical protein SEA_JOSELITO_54 [Mycobacterium phage Joselito]AXH50733.1 helix-turn-helix DNA-binding domain protein [Mycobacterium phage Snape]QBI98225.1 helix-turn-helix DNA-binding domain protein [Mycobacterium phage Bowtie]QBI98424.1 helix-turn-helix DNA-binding domain protein
MNSVFTRAARSALAAWKGDYSQDEDLVNDLWVWYLESPKTQAKLEKADAALRHTLVRRAALQILAKKALEEDIATGRAPYSTENVKEALAGESTNKYLVDILPRALKELAEKNDRYAEAIRSRYEDGILPPKKGGEAMTLSRAVKSLTERVNVIAITAGIRRDEEGRLLDKEGPGSRHAVFPETRKSHGDGHSDPTADIAIALIEHPELRDEFLYETPLPEFLGGRGVAA